MASVQLKALSYDDYISGEQNSEFRHELVDGQLYAMGGSTAEHNLIAGNLFVALKLGLRGSGCQVFFADMNVRIEEQGCYPDVFVSCTHEDDQAYYKTQPVLIAEVLSDSTARIDRGKKFDEYRQLDSLECYLLLSQTAVHIEHFSRANGWRKPDVLLMDGTLELTALGLSIPVAEIYDDILLS